MDNEVTLITGPFRSGTSLLTGLLESCGFDLGRRFNVLRTPSEHNPHGHLEVDYLIVLNLYLLGQTVPNDAYSSWFPIAGIPDGGVFLDYCRSQEKLIRYFIGGFDGNLCKDPHFCLTLPGWKQYWKEARRVIFCLRNPAEAALSMSKRYEISYDAALDIWYRYTDRFYRSSWDESTIIFDLASFYRDPAGTLEELLKELGRSDGKKIVEKAVGERWSPEWIHKGNGASIKSLPSNIRTLYESLMGHKASTEFR